MQNTTPPEVVREIRAEMGRQGLTVASLARTTDNIPAKRLYARFERPETFTLDELFEVAGALNIDLADLFERATHRSAA